jgi:hypothetical protein
MHQGASTNTKQTSTDRLVAFIQSLRARGIGRHQPAFDEQKFRATAAANLMSNAHESADEARAFGHHERAEKIMVDARIAATEIDCGAQRDPAKVAA